MSTEKSIWEPITYSSTNFMQQNIAGELIKEIHDNRVYNADIIVDIGCGSGNVTEKFSQRIPHNKIYAFDLDRKMIAYANDHHSNNGRIEYLTQDVSVKWEQLDEKLKALEGKVSIVWCNMVFHWIKNKSIAAQNISRLLTPGGGFYAQIALLREPFQFAENDLKKIKVFGTQDEQIETILSVFKNCDFSVLNGRIVENEHTYESLEELWTQSEGFYNAVDKDLLIPAANKHFGGDLTVTIKTMRDNHLANYRYQLQHNHHVMDSPNKLHRYLETYLLSARK